MKCDFSQPIHTPVPFSRIEQCSELATHTYPGKCSCEDPVDLTIRRCEKHKLPNRLSEEERAAQARGV